MPSPREPSESVLAQVEQLLHDPDPARRSEVARALGGQGEEAGAALKALHQAMRADRPEVSLEAASAILRIRPDERAAVDRLVVGLRDPDPLIREQALTALEDVKGWDPVIVPALLGCLSDPEVDQRFRALEVLPQFTPGALGKSAEVAEAVAKVLAGDPDAEVRRATLCVFEGLRPPGRTLGAQALLAAATDDPDAYTRERAILRLGRLARVEPAAVRALAELLARGPLAAQRLAARALAGLGEKAEPALPELIEALSSADDEVWSYAAAALGGVGPGATEALPALEKLVREKTTENSEPREALQAIDKIRGQGE
jgi:HEAT repeat protein